MTHRYSSISLDELSAAGVRMRHADAVAIARDLALRAASGELPGLPAPHSLRLNSDGSIATEGPIAVGRPVQDAARLLEALLSRASADVVAPATFRIVVGRAYARDEAAFTSLEQFVHALTPFAAADVSAVVRTLVTVANSLDFGLSEFDSEDSPATAVTLRPARERRRPAARQLAWARSPRLALAGAIAIVVLAAVVLGLRSLPVDEPDEVAVTRDASGDSSSNPAGSGESARSGATSSSPVLGSDAVAPIAPDNLARSSAAGRRSPAAPTQPRSTVSGVAPVTQRQRSAISAIQVLPNAAFSPTFAATTSAMFYHSGAGPRSAIMRADTGSDGGVLRVTEIVDDRASNFHPRPSPDGQWIAFDSDRDGERGVYVADANGRGVRRVSGEGFAAVPSWSPDGKRLAFVRAEPGRPRVWNIWTVDVATGVTARITSHHVGQPWGAAWFPDGDRIAYSHEDRLIVRSLAGNSVRIFNSPIPRRLVRTPAISPDGNSIIFQVRHNGAWMLDLAGDSMRRILDDPSAEEFTWSGDGRRVAYHSRRSGGWGVWIMAPR